MGIKPTNTDNSPSSPKPGSIFDIFDWKAVRQIPKLDIAFGHYCMCCITEFDFVATARSLDFCPDLCLHRMKGFSCICMLYIASPFCHVGVDQSEVTRRHCIRLKGSSFCACHNFPTSTAFIYFHPCLSETWPSLYAPRFFCLIQCLWSVLLRMPSQPSVSSTFSLSFSVLCISGRLNSPFLSKQSCDPEPLRSPVRQASPLQARGTQTHLIISSLSHFPKASVSPYFMYWLFLSLFGVLCSN